VAGAANWNFDTSLFVSAPGKAGRANANTAIVMVVRAFRRNNLTLVSGGAPRKASLESEAVSTLVMSFTAFRNLNAGL